MGRWATPELRGLHGRKQMSDGLAKPKRQDALDKALDAWETDDSNCEPGGFYTQRLRAKMQRAINAYLAEQSERPLCIFLYGGPEHLESWDCGKLENDPIHQALNPARCRGEHHFVAPMPPRWRDAILDLRAIAQGDYTDGNNARLMNIADALQRDTNVQAKCSFTLEQLDRIAIASLQYANARKYELGSIEFREGEVQRTRAALEVAING
jgi:hypothetical protein